MKSTLLRQLEKYQLSESRLPESLESWQNFLRAITKTYDHLNEDRLVLERALEISSQEMEEKMEQLERSSQQLFETSRLTAIGTASSGIAHELNNPIAAIKGYCELLEMQTELSAGSKNLVHRVLQLTDRMSLIVQSLRKLSRRTKIEEFEVFDIRHAINESLELFGFEFRLDAINVEFQYPQQDIYVFGDKSAMFSVFQNIFANSRDAFKSRKSATEKYINVNLSADSEHVFIKLVDNAGGIPEEHLKTIFEAFFTTKPPGVGTGLGLSIVKAVIDSHKGTINVESHDGQTCFSIVFPRAKIFHPEKSVDDVSGGPSRSGSVINPQLKVEESLVKYRLVVVDDEPDINQIISLLLDDHFEVTSFVNPMLALDHIRNHPVDIILTDYRMPYLSGEELIAKVREFNRHIPIAIMSGHADLNPEDLKKIGAGAIIAKPWPSPEYLIQAILGIVPKS